ncbi:DarT ssDNA thymidine ADP-ribosyltransferase family protein [Synechocystis sp. PCC 7509]|uniref:DarT ssDNA thymidine ADP-ribosyltransferase family protein n=1 Tax=Synechocystis sp. PCC 7509 TaxID=927677 RepID=UPI0002ACA2A6|nr:DarT ssDNA thymidine ADP-ribosyltransferase family protein [Synechocystis sp. PCC 7509]
MKRKKTVDSFYYITHSSNLKSILERGILSHTSVAKQFTQSKTIYDNQIVLNRKNKTTPNGKSLWDFTNFYFQPRNPMLYRVLREHPNNGIIVLAIKPSILNIQGTFITTGNAANELTNILPASSYKEVAAQIIKGIDIEWWNSEDGSKRKIMAECLVPESVPSNLIQSIYVSSQKAKHNIEETLNSYDNGNFKQLPVIVEPETFFLPQKSIRFKNAQNISFIEGDMFFSRMQTMTISVNCIGVMGKGLASTAKYRFPDMYVYYQDLCRNGTLKMGSPYVYKRESSIFTELAEDTNLEEISEETGFLLFPTKHHWRNNSDINGIEQGLQWLQENYKKEGIKSLAMPALGCGLGNLDWQDVCPLMCDYLKKLDIHVSIYWPASRPFPEGQFYNQDLPSRN